MYMQIWCCPPCCYGNQRKARGAQTLGKPGWRDWSKGDSPLSFALPIPAVLIFLCLTLSLSPFALLSLHFSASLDLSVFIFVSVSLCLLHLYLSLLWGFFGGDGGGGVCLFVSQSLSMSVYH